VKLMFEHPSPGTSQWPTRHASLHDELHKGIRRNYGLRVFTGE